MNNSISVRISPNTVRLCCVLLYMIMFWWESYLRTGQQRRTSRGGWDRWKLTTFLLDAFGRQALGSSMQLAELLTEALREAWSDLDSAQKIEPEAKPTSCELSRVSLYRFTDRPYCIQIGTFPIWGQQTSNYKKRQYHKIKCVSLSCRSVDFIQPKMETSNTCLANTNLRLCVLR